MSRARVRLGVVGLGHLGRFHAHNLATRVSDVELVRVVDAHEPTASEVGGALGVDWATSYDALLGDDSIAGVVIVTPTSLHVEMIEQAAAAGKHVFTEKPISLDVPAGLRAIEAATRAGVHLQVGFHRHFDPDYVAAAERIQAGDLGALQFVRSTQRDAEPPGDTDYLPSCGDFFVDALIHDFDCARWFGGEIVEVSAYGASISSDIFSEVGDVDNAVIALRFASGAVGIVDGSRSSGYGYEAGVEVMGTEATLRISRNRVTNVECLTMGTSKRDYVVEYQTRFVGAYVEELVAFAGAIRGEREVAVGGREAIAAFLVAQAASRSHAEGRPVAVEDPGSVLGQ